MKLEPLMYRRSIVTFIDILGFGNLVATNTVEQIQDALRLLRNVSVWDYNDEVDDASFVERVIQFSDSIVRVRPLVIGQELAPFGTFCGEVRDLAHIQGFYV